ncbi:FecR family protein [Flagellimonas aequoris]|uniref:DUF4974 domain-containing protein n=1 Tax=Flagellimonas aequoris TaxID=2306997 RepID=A0A418NAL4_9FLAO|nr:FecR family protein [Allomuricauda aequoris]RIV72374.1 DUF4974 domain-containing protein [Allomuricauda aequoris]TXK04400.1 DUF4974 domain-containing protein [Allomuricauda aequoris]
MKYLNKKQAQSLFEKYLKGECSPEEERLLETFLDSYQDDSKIWTDWGFDASKKQEIWDKIKQQTGNEKKYAIGRVYHHDWIKYAAVVVGITLVSLFYFKNSTAEGHLLPVDEEMVVLQTGEGKNNLSENSAGDILDKDGKVIASQEGGVLSYKKNSLSKELVYNEINVPKGKTFKLVLSDGTQVYLNAGTNLRFPISFVPGNLREVFLEGEAYFEVTRDEENPFVVQSNDMQVKVLGTHFNVSSYEGSEQHAVLVEGSVSVSHQGSSMEISEPLVIKPGQKASLVPEGLDVKEVDAGDYIAWTQDILIFNDESFPEIIKKIERRYNVEIQNNYTELTSARFNGKFNEESIIDLMNTFKESANFDYQINDGKIIINKKESGL